MPILGHEVSLHPSNLLEGVSDLLEGVSDSDLRRWWAVYTKSRQEKALARQLVGHGVPFYLPLIPKDNVIRGRRVRSYVPLFGGYVFMFGTEDERATTLTTNRISRILPVPDQEQLRIDLRNVKE